MTGVRYVRKQTSKLSYKVVDALSLYYTELQKNKKVYMPAHKKSPVTLDSILQSAHVLVGVAHVAVSVGKSGVYGDRLVVVSECVALRSIKKNDSTTKRTREERDGGVINTVRSSGVTQEGGGRKGSRFGYLILAVRSLITRP